MRFIKWMYNKTHYYCYKILVTIFPVGMSKYKYKRILHKNLDIKNPKTFNEKIQDKISDKCLRVCDIG